MDVHTIQIHGMGTGRHDDYYDREQAEGLAAFRAANRQLLHDLEKVACVIGGMGTSQRVMVARRDIEKRAASAADCGFSFRVEGGQA